MNILAPLGDALLVGIGLGKLRCDFGLVLVDLLEPTGDLLAELFVVAHRPILKGEDCIVTGQCHWSMSLVISGTDVIQQSKGAENG